MANAPQNGISLRSIKAINGKELPSKGF